MSYNEFIGIGIQEVLMNLLSFHEFTKKINSTVILLCHTRLVGYYLSNGLFILQRDSNNLSSAHNEAKTNS